MSVPFRPLDRGRPVPRASLVIATYQRTESVRELLAQLDHQTLPFDEFEVIVVDDGSTVPAAPTLAADAHPYELTVLTQANAGPAAARHRGILQARAAHIVILDDDMRIEPDFLAQHLAAHEGRGAHVVLGRLRPPAGERLELFDRYQLDSLDKLAARAAVDPAAVHGSDLYTGNVSFRRDDYLRVGGFDPAFRISEDAELGIRLELAGATFALSDAATSYHASDHTSVAKWMARSEEYGRADAAVSDKHPRLPSANPWRFIFLVNPVSRPVLLASAGVPGLMKPVAWLAMRLSQALAGLGLERVALAGTTFTYGMQYYRGLATVPEPEQGGTRLQRYLNHTDGPPLGFFGKCAKCLADIRADHRASRAADARYSVNARSGSLLGDAIQRIGFQMMVAYRIMRLQRAIGLGIFARITSRLIRHLYSADIHWDADLAPGVIIVHGTGLVISHAARVGPGCILFQHVTLGESIHPTTREIGGPLLEGDVHVGPGATILGPITVGRDTKIMASATLMTDVPPGSLVETPAPTVRVRSRQPHAADGAVLGAIGSVPAEPEGVTLHPEPQATAPARDHHAHS